MQLRQRHAGAARLREQLANERAGLLGAFPRAPPRRELADKRPRPMANLDEALRLEIAIGLRDRSGAALPSVPVAIASRTRSAIWTYRGMGLRGSIP
ncbi:MAG: hypothetical protein DMD64_14365 [Gemmatimonadetes bacterium]|nr:MAG: hypothetical protein DMD64_14365 [Gemmatimonadota bacterium]